ncbi:MAG: CDP-glucose 4,6-dehydratase [Fibrobacteres bacterium]|nr:CDP-glucose 4,6-dehydratase [Fibrobacterota bacterium]
MGIKLRKLFSGKTVLITGSTGFKGSWLSIWLHSCGAKVVGYALPPKSRRDNFVICGLDKKVKQIHADIRDVKRLKSVFSAYKPDFAFHLAAQPLVLESYRSPFDTFETNIMGTAAFLEAVREQKSVRSAVVITTDKVYQNEYDGHPFVETDPLGGHDPYSASKAGAEIVSASYIKSFFSDSKTAIATARAGNVIGGGDYADNRIVPDCIRALEAGKPIEIRNPSAVRPWQHVLEPLGGYIELAAALYKYGKKYEGGWNFGPNVKESFSVEKVVDAVIREWGSGSKVVSAQKKKVHEAPVLRLNIDKAKKQLGWKPKLDFKDTIRLTVEEYKCKFKSPGTYYAQRLEHIRFWERL